MPPRSKKQPQEFDQSILTAPTSFQIGVQSMISILGGVQEWKPPFVEYEKDPVGFIRGVLGVKNLTQEQVVICESVRDSRLTNVQASHGIGKTFISACLVLWWLFAVGGVVVTTAPTEQQVKNLLWKEIRRLHASHEAVLGGVCDTLQLKVNEEAFAYGFTAKDYSKDSFQGIHEKKLLLIQDEANGISQDINDGFESCITGSNNRGLKIGNPVTPSTPFHESCIKSHIRIPVWSHPNVVWAYELHSDGIHRLKPHVAKAIVQYDAKGYVTILPQEQWPPEFPRDIIDGAASISWIEEIARPKGETSSYWIARVEGIFPVDSAFSIIPSSLFRSARARYDLDREYWDTLAGVHESRLGVDVGDSQDPHAFARWQGPVLYSVEEIATQGDQHDQERCAAHAVGILREYPGEAHVDRIGVGASVPGMIQNEGLDAYGIAWSESELLDDPAQFMNRKIEDSWILREALQKGEAVIAPLGKYEDKLAEECAGTYYEQMPSEKYKIELKAKTRKRLKRSTNLLDSVVYGHTNKTSVAALVEKAMELIS